MTKGIDIQKLKALQSTLDGAAEEALIIAVAEYLESDGKNWTAKNTLEKLGVLIKTEIPSNTSVTDNTIQLNS
jgi:hypothetical protein